MRYAILLAGMILLGVSFASADVIEFSSGFVTIQMLDAEVLPTDTALLLMITAKFDQPEIYSLGGFNMKIDITGDEGCTFADAQQPDSDYLLDGATIGFDPGSIVNGGLTIEEITDARSDEGYNVDASSGDVTLNVAQISLSLSGIEVGDTFVLTFDTASYDDTALFTWSGEFYGDSGPDITWKSGTIMVVPEPSTLALLIGFAVGVPLLRRFQ